MKRILDRLPYIMLMLTLFSYPLDHWDPFRGTISQAEQWRSLPQILTYITALVWLFYTFILGRTQYLTNSFKSPITFCVLIFLFISFLSTVNSIDPAFSIKVVLKRVALFGVFIMIINIIWNKRAMKILMIALAISALFDIGVSLYELSTGDMFLSRMAFGRTELVGASRGMMRIQALETDPDLLCMVLLLLTGPVLYMVFAAKRTISKICWLTLLTLLCVSLIATGSRWGWGTFGLMTLAIFIFLRFQHKMMFAVISILVLTVSFVIMAMIPSLTVWDKIERLFSSGDRDIGFQEREAKIKMSLEMVRDHPFLGVGTGRCEKETPKYLRRGSRMGTREVESSISGAATLLGDNGLLGFLAYSFLYLMIILEIIIGQINTEDVEWKNLGGSILISMLADIFCLIGFPSLGFRYSWVFYGLGASYAIISRQEESDKKSEGNPVLS
jgi:hypothetical protein